MAAIMKPGSVSANFDVTPLYQDFEPYCEWKRGEDLLLVHIQDFKKEHLKVLVNSSGVLKISGERPLQEARDHQVTRVLSKQRFYKETRAPEGCNIEDIHAKMANGILTITFPRRSPRTSYNPPLAETKDQTMLMQGKKAVGSDVGGGDRGYRGGPNGSVLENVLGKCGVEYKDDDDEVGFGRFKVAKKIVVGVGVAVVAMVAIGALVGFKPTSNSSTSSSSSGSSSSSTSSSSSGSSSSSSDSLMRAVED